MAMKSTHLLYFSMLAAASSLCFASETRNFDKTLEVKRYRIGPIARIVIHNASASSFSEDARCAGLMINEKRIRFFLANAKPDSEHNFKYEMQTGSCQAEGVVHFKNGRKASLFLDNATGWGGLTERGTTYFLRCDSCESILEPDFTFDPEKMIDWR
jgi:hypothetical protein